MGRSSKTEGTGSRSARPSGRSEDCQNESSGQTRWVIDAVDLIPTQIPVKRALVMAPLPVEFYEDIGSSKCLVVSTPGAGDRVVRAGEDIFSTVKEIISAHGPEMWYYHLPARYKP
ncbi:hypothetical protein [Bacteriophage sp.]|nr:hypothetical protein [Bacteriophage sp.]UOF80137.1 hypothetical protein [Bacteriophage sp.]